MIRRESGLALREARRLNSSVSTAMNGLTEMNGTIRSLNRGILFLNMKITFYAVRYALMKFLRSIRTSTWDLVKMSKADLKRKKHKGRRKVGSNKRKNRRRARLGLRIRRK